MRTIVTVVITAIVAIWIGIDVGLNTNSIKYIGATTYAGPHISLEILGNGEMRYTKFPIEIYYSLGGDSPAEKKVVTKIYAAAGTLDCNFPGEVGSGNAYAHLNFHAFIEQGDSGISTSILTIAHPYNDGVIQLENGQVILIAGNEKEQEALKAAAKIILDNI